MYTFTLSQFILILFKACYKLIIWLKVLFIPTRPTVNAKLYKVRINHLLNLHSIQDILLQNIKSTQNLLTTTESFSSLKP